ncbi:MAG: ImmA/IrrE family metallo-endopeptidase [Gammaproteobacteria bacterium]|nr:ImmA/IrrE family metallo-endopeptidase [Gammaproteobacteria bacterium]
MTKTNSYPLIKAKAKAKELISRYGVTELPVDPFDIAHKLDIQTCAKPSSQKGGISGALVRSGNSFGILYAANIPNIGYQRFTVAHEIGHYVLDGHMDHLQLQDGGIHYSKAGFHGDRYEREADYFASQLLMPDSLFVKVLAANDDGMSAIKNLADRCQTSLTATAIRYAETTDSASVIVVSEQDKILYTFFSDMAREFKLGYPRKNSPLPNTSITCEINRSEDPLQGRDGDTNIEDWFDCSFALQAREEVMRLGNYEKTLTVLTIDNDYEDITEDEDMLASWEVKF